MRILLVEDNERLRAIVGQAFSGRGFAVDTAECAADAEAAVQAIPYQAVILDLGLPDRDGMTVLELMILTKGLTRYASGNSAVIVREVAGKRQTINVRLSDLIKDGDIDQNVAMLPGDTLIIPQSYF